MSDDLPSIEVHEFDFVPEINERTGKSNSCKAYVSATIGNSLTVHGMQVVKWQGILRVNMPRRRVSDTQWLPLVEIHDKPLENAIFNAVLGAYYQRPSKHASGTHQSTFGPNIRNGNGDGWHKSPG